MVLVRFLESFGRCLNVSQFYRFSSVSSSECFGFTRRGTGWSGFHNLSLGFGLSFLVLVLKIRRFGLGVLQDETQLSYILHTQSEPESNTQPILYLTSSGTHEVSFSLQTPDRCLSSAATKSESLSSQERLPNAAAGAHERWRPGGSLGFSGFWRTVLEMSGGGFER